MSVRKIEGTPPTDLEIPACTLEDVDRALFTLFDKEIPFTHKHKEGAKKIPVVFATGERFAILRRKEPLKDKTGALILPLISIMRTGITQNPSMGMGTNQIAPSIIKRKLSPDDAEYQRLVNRHNFKNSDDLVSDLAKQTTAGGSLPGRVATRRHDTKEDVNTKKGDILSPVVGNNIFEIIEIPAPRYYVATYEVTFWAQYTAQMNEMLMTLMSMYQSGSQQAFRIETDKGYWFVAYAGEQLSSGHNFDNFTDNERLVKYSLDITVPAYIVGSAFSGAENTLRKYVSAPQISFNTEFYDANLSIEPPANVRSGDASSYILEDIEAIDSPEPGQSIGHKDSRIIKASITNVGGEEVAAGQYIYEELTDPFTGKKVRKRVLNNRRIRRKGETIYKESFK